ncbi:MAG TPA: hypothetical protein VF918_09675 [Anaerolineales bacterium]
MNPKIIVIDGKTYNSVEEMPPDIRQKYEAAMRSLGDANDNRIPDAFENVNILADKNKNGVPDVVEDLVAGQAVVNSMKIIVDGKEFNSLEGLPPEARARYEEAMGKLDANRNGIPDFVEGMLKTPNQTTSSSTSFSVATPRSSTPVPVSPTITPDTSNGLMLALAGLFIFLLCVVAGGAVWYFFLR